MERERLEGARARLGIGLDPVGHLVALALCSDRVGAERDRARGSGCSGSSIHSLPPCDDLELVFDARAVRDLEREVPEVGAGETRAAAATTRRPKIQWRRLHALGVAAPDERDVGALDEREAVRPARNASTCLARDRPREADARRLASDAAGQRATERRVLDAAARGVERDPRRRRRTSSRSRPVELAVPSK